MSTTVEDISLFLQTNTQGTEATDLFCYRWGINAPDNAILVSSGGGGPPPQRFIGIPDTLNEVPVTILVRNLDIFEAATKAQAIFDLLDNNKDNPVPGYYQVVCEQAAPNFIDIEETDEGSGLYRYYFSINVTTKFVKS